MAVKNAGNNQADPNSTVIIKIPRDRQKGKGLYVSVNDRRFFIPRGETVSVPYYIAAAIEESVAQDEHVAVLIEKLGESADF